ncbi:MAG: protein kinase family protein [Rhodospirillaceae bacterium]|nr:protein kinase family protein [Rhodospirillaceae bacterium]
MAEVAPDLKEAPARESAAAPPPSAPPAAAPAAATPAAPPPAANGQSATPPPQAPRAAASGSFIIVRDRYTIYCDKPIPALDMPNAQAFEVTDRKQEGRPLYALVCKPEMLPRISVMRVLKGNEMQSLLHLVDWGVAEWPPIDRKCAIVIYYRPLGGRVMESMTGTARRIPDHVFPKSVIKPLADALVELSQKGITHRAIRPDNLYYMDEAQTRIVLGDCVTAVPGCDQPAVLETIESGMCLPTARGGGTFADDMYALGASLLVLAIGRNTLQGVPDGEIIRRKIKDGSYSTLVGEERVPVSLIEFFRGLVTDDIDQRWKAENIELWLAGKRLTPVQAKSEPQAQRAFKFADLEFHSIRPLSYAMYLNWDKAAKVITDGSLEIWIRRGLELNDLADAVASAIKNARAMAMGGQPKDMEDLLVARVLMVLDPRAPVRMREFCVHLEGFGPSLAVAMLSKQKLQPYTDFINRELWRHWVTAQTKYNADNAQWETVYKDLRNYLKDPNSGAGIERCVYDLNEWMYCLSPLIADQYVMEVKGVLPALETVSKTVNTKMWPVDRHIAAFMRARYAKGVSTQIDAMNDPRPDRATIGMLSVLAIVQWRLGPEALYGLASWVAGLMGPVINAYQSRPKRKEIEKEMPKLVRKGNLAEIYNYLDNPEERQRDAEGFAWAKAEYAAAERQAYDLEHGHADRQESAIQQGRKSGSIAAVVVLFLSFTGFILSQIF